MGKRKKGSRKKRRDQITRRDPEAKKQRRSDPDADDDALADELDEDDPDEDDDAHVQSADGSDEDRSDEDPSADDGDEGLLDDYGDRDSAPGLPTGAAWAKPLVKFEHAWTWLEVRLMFTGTILLILLLVLMVALNGLNQPVETQAKAGIVFRALFGASVLGGIGWWGLGRVLDEKKRKLVTAVGIVIGLVTASLWRDQGIEWASRMLAWLESGSTIALLGGPKTLSARVVMFVALIGGSLAAATGRHIMIDAALRLVPKSLRKPINLGSSLATVGICFTITYALFAWIAITGYGASEDSTFGEKVEVVQDSMGDQFFLWRKQAKLDVRTLPSVLKGDKYSESMTGREWNEFFDDNGFVERFGDEASKVRALDSALDRPRVPFVQLPNTGSKELVKGLDLVFPIGFLMMALRLLLRTLLVFGGHIAVRLEGELDESDANSDDADSDEGDADHLAEEGAA